MCSPSLMQPGFDGLQDADAGPACGEPDADQEPDPPVAELAERVDFRLHLADGGLDRREVLPQRPQFFREGLELAGNQCVVALCLSQPRLDAAQQSGQLVDLAHASRAARRMASITRSGGARSMVTATAQSSCSTTTSGG